MYVWLQLTTHNKFDWLNSTPWTAMATSHEFVCAGTWIDPFEMQCIYLFILTSVLLKTNMFTGIKTVHFGLCQWKYRNPNGRKPNTNQNCSRLTYVTYINQKIFTFRVKIQCKSNSVQVSLWLLMWPLFLWWRPVAWLHVQSKLMFGLKILSIKQVERSPLCQS